MEYLRRKFTNLGLYKLIMTFCLIFIAGVNSVYAEEAEPKVTITLSDVTLREAFTQIEEVIDFRFFYDENSFDVNKKVSIKANEWPLKKVITTLLKGTGMTFKINERQIVLLHEEKEEVVKRTVTGIITDINGEPLIGASVVVEGTSNGTITDFDGNFSIMAPEGSNLVFSYVGYRDYIASVKGDKAMNISLEEDSQVLSDVVVTALGIKREKKMLGYSVQDLKSDEINTTGDASITSALQGKVAGLQMNTSSTGLGGSTKITIRGNSSFTDDNQPRYAAARLGENGPVLAVQQISGMGIYSSYQTVLIPGEQYEDGSEEFIMTVVCSPMRSDVELRLNIFVAGVIFDDGTVSKVLRSADFDETGITEVRFIRSADATSSVCHNLSAYQNNEYMGIRTR